jgi:hypothetical protein
MRTGIGWSGRLVRFPHVLGRLVLIRPFDRSVYLAIAVRQQQADNETLKIVMAGVYAPRLRATSPAREHAKRHLQRV